MYLGVHLDLNLDLNLDGVNVVDVVVIDYPRQRIDRVLSLKARRPVTLTKALFGSNGIPTV